MFAVSLKTTIRLYFFGDNVVWELVNERKLTQ